MLGEHWSSCHTTDPMVDISEYKVPECVGQPAAKKARLDTGYQDSSSSKELEKQKNMWAKVLINREVPFDFFTKPVFQNFVSSFNKEFELPRTDEEMMDCISEEAEKCRKRIRNMLESRKSDVSLGLAVHKYGAIVAAYFVDKDFKLRNVLLAVTNDISPPTEEEFRNTIRPYNLQLHHISHVSFYDAYSTDEVSAECLQCYRNSLSVYLAGKLTSYITGDRNDAISSILENIINNFDRDFDDDRIYVNKQPLVNECHYIVYSEQNSVSEVFDFLMNMKERIRKKLMEMNADQRIMDEFSEDFDRKFSRFLNPHVPDFNPILIVAAAFDPNQAFYLNGAIEKNELVEIIKKEVLRSSSLASLSFPVDSENTVSFSEEMKREAQLSSLTKAIELMVNNFIRGIHSGSNAIDFWKQPQKELEILQHAALSILSIPISSKFMYKISSAIDTMTSDENENDSDMDNMSDYTISNFERFRILGTLDNRMIISENEFFD